MVKKREYKSIFLQKKLMIPKMTGAIFSFQIIAEFSIYFSFFFNAQIPGEIFLKCITNKTWLTCEKIRGCLDYWFFWKNFQKFPRWKKATWGAFRPCYRPPQFTYIYIDENYYFMLSLGALAHLMRFCTNSIRLLFATSLSIFFTSGIFSIWAHE